MKKISQVFIGVDVSKDTLDIHINPIEKALKIRNNEEEIIKFIGELDQLPVGGIGCESTGGYEGLLKKLLKTKMYDLWVVDPRRIKGFMASKNYKSKTDKTDAKSIAQFISANQQDYKVFAKTPEQEMVQALVNRKNDVIKYLVSEKTRLIHPSHEYCKDSIVNLIKTLNEEIKRLDLEIAKLIENSTDLSVKAKMLMSIPGIGKASAALLLSFVPELGQLSNVKIAGLVGLCPYENESGKYKGKKFIKGGRPAPRKILYMCALTAIKYDDGLKAFYNRLIEKNKPFKVAIVGVMHKLIIFANALLKSSEYYRPKAAVVMA